MKLRVPAVTAAVVLAIGAMAAPAAHAATGVVISQAAFGGPGGGNDEVVEIRNTTAATIDISGWTLMASNELRHRGYTRDRARRRRRCPPARPSCSPTPRARSRLRATSSMAPGSTNTGGIQIRNGSTVMDAFGSTAVQATFREGAGIAQPSSGAGGFIRKNGGTQDTDDNVADFTGPHHADPDEVRHRLHRPGRPGSMRPGSGRHHTDHRHPDARRQRGVQRHHRQGPRHRDRHRRPLRLELRRDLQGRFRHLDPGADARPTPPRPRTPCSSPASAATPANPAGVIGSEITISGRVETKFGQVGIVPNGVGNTGSPAAQEVALSTVATIDSDQEAFAGAGHPRPREG